MDLRTEQWDDSYGHKDNFVFYPHEEIIRFVSKYFKKRIGIEEFQIVKNANKCLDLGCGIGRHVFYLDEYGFTPFGVDLSKVAIDIAKKWCIYKKKENLLNSFSVADATNLHYENSEFDFIVSHGVLDSMRFEIAQKVMSEAYRVLKPEGLMYIDLIAGENDTEVIVECQHEKNTIQSFFTIKKINELINGQFVIIENTLHHNKSLVNGGINSRYHLILQRI